MGERTSAQIYPVDGRPAGGDPGDEDLVRGLREGEPLAYETLLDRFEGPLYRFFYYSHRDHELAQDQCGETFANLILAIHKMRGDAGCLRAFVFGVARNVLRRSWRQRKLILDSEDRMVRVRDPRPSPLRQAADRADLERAMEAIETMEEPVRQILLLRFVEGMPLIEVAEALDLPLGTVKSHIHRSRRRLRRILGEP